MQARAAGCPPHACYLSVRGVQRVHADAKRGGLEGGGPREGLLALGYAGWGPGQLDSEIQQNAWLSVPADDTLMFDSKHDTKWRRAFAKLKVDPLQLSDVAGHA